MKQNLDYTDPAAAVNFRDVGLFINLISGSTLLSTTLEIGSTDLAQRHRAHA